MIGNVKLKILSERMVKNGSGPLTAAPTHTRSNNEKLVVKWQTCGKADTENSRHMSETFESVTDIARTRSSSDGQFTGLFIFDFDDQGRIVHHTIEHTEEDHNWEKTNRFISVTDWLLGRAWGRREDTPSLAYVQCVSERRRCRGRT